MTTEEKQQLIENIFASELDYQEIKERADELKAKGSLTTEEQAILVDYENELQHDKDVITIWIGKLIADGVVNLNTPTRLALRKQVLDELKDREWNAENTGINIIQSFIDDLNKKKIIPDEEVKLRELFKRELESDEIGQSDYDSQIAHWNMILAKKQKRLAILDNLKLLTKTLWQP
jgi:hypothetical protein